MTAVEAPRARPSTLAWFLLPSLVGLFLFVTPIPTPDGVSIPIAMLAGAVRTAFEAALPYLALGIMTVSVVGAIWAAAARPDLSARPLARSLFQVGPVWTAIRALGLIVAVIVVFQLGPEAIWGENTGTLILDLTTLLVSVFLIAGLLLPLLLDFGLLEFAGTLMTKVMRPLFRVPGRSSVSSLAAWLGDGSIGVLMTAQQYQKGYFTRREAVVLGTTFNVVSVTFTIVIVEMLGLTHMFGPFYLTTVVAGVVAALIMPRIPPLSRFPDDLHPDATHSTADEERPEAGPMLPRAWRAALRRADEVTPGEVLRTSASNVLEMWIGILPVIMAIGTAAVMIAEFTPLFTWLGMPFIPVLELMGVPDAARASEAMFIGFADMLLPSILIQGTAPMTMFIIGALSVTQLIYMSEVGGLLLASAIPVTFRHLVMVFLLRTLITLPVIVGMAHLFF